MTNKKIKLEIVYSANNDYKIKILEKYGKGAITYKNKLYEIVRFISSRFEFVYIPTIRIEEQSINIIDNLITRSILNLSHEEKEYIEALKIVD